jgi:hypothetical protein
MYLSSRLAAGMDTQIQVQIQIRHETRIGTRAGPDNRGPSPAVTGITPPLAQDAGRPASP